MARAWLTAMRVRHLGSASKLLATEIDKGRRLASDFFQCSVSTVVVVSREQDGVVAGEVGGDDTSWARAWSRSFPTKVTADLKLDTTTTVSQSKATTIIQV